MSMSSAELQKLALSQVVYSEYLPEDGNPNNQGEPWTIEELIKANLIKGTSYDSGTQQYIFSPALSALSGMLDWTLVNFQPNTTSGFAGAAFQDPSDELVFAFRGTEPTLFTDPLRALQDFNQDLQIAMDTNLSGPSQFEDAFDFWISTLQQVGSGNYDGYSFTGHSLGGGLAQYMVYMTNEAGHAVTFNAVGIGQTLDGANPSDYNDSIKDYVNQNDIIGQYGVQLGTTIYMTDMGNYEYNSTVDNAQVALQIAVMQALKRGDITQAQAMAALNGLSEIGQGIHNTGSDLFFGAHNLDTFVTSTGDPSQEVSGPNVAIAALTKVINGYFTVSGWVVDGVNYIAVEVIPAVGEATVKVTLAIVDGGVQVVTAIGGAVWDWINFMGNTTADIIYNTAVAIGNAADNVAEVAVVLYQYLFGEHIVINGTDSTDSLYSVLNKSTVIYGYMGNDTISGSGYADVLDGGLGDDYIYGNDGNDYIYGRHGNDTLMGGLGGDILFGDAGNDILYGDTYSENQNGYYTSGDGNDTLDGGTGDDFLYGGAGDDTYIFGRGYGHDTISDYHKSSVWLYQFSNAGFDTLKFLPGVSPEDISVHRRGDYDLELSIIGTNDKVTILGYFAPYAYSVIEQAVFANGIVWDEATIREKARYIYGTHNSEGVNGYNDQGDILQGYEGDDVIFTFGGNDVIYAGNGSDTVQGGEGDDIIYGGAGNDTLYGDTLQESLNGNSTSGSGNDVLDGGTGNDFLYGGAGDDTYIFGIGYGQDTIYDWHRTGIYSSYLNAGFDTLKFLTGIAPEDVFVHRRNSTDLEFSIIGTSDKVTVLDHFSSGGYNTIDQAVFADNSVWDLATINDKARHIHGTGSSETIYGYDDQADIVYGYNGDDTIKTYDGDDVVYADSGNDTVQSGEGHDAIYGGSGDDVLYGDSYSSSPSGTASSGNGDDILDGGTGNDLLYGGAGDDTYIFGIGYGQDTIHDWHKPGIYSNYLNAGFDALKFLPGVDPQDVEVRRVGSNLEFSITGTTDTMTVLDHFASSGYHTIDQVIFDDETVWDVATVNDRVRYIYGTNSNDTIYGYGDQADIVHAGAGDDTVYTYEGDDVLTGGLGDDVLYGGAGNDVYIFNSGDGVDVIHESSGDDSAALNRNVMNIIFGQSGSNLQVTFAGSSDEITVNSWYTGSNYQVETFEASEGFSITNTQVEQLIQAMASWSSNNGGMSWSQALTSNPQDVQAVVSQYWTAPTV